MELIREIYDRDIDSEAEMLGDAYNLRKASRAVVINEHNEIAILYVAKNEYHKLPGGGIEGDENTEDALRREIMEEVGVKIEGVDDIGVIIEYRNLFQQIQISYCYYARAIGEAEKPSFTDHELSEGFKLKWVDFEQAIHLMEKDVPNNYVGRFIQRRDLEFLKYAKDKLKGRLG